MCIYGIERYVSFDLGMLSKYMYYTGVIFRAYTFGTGDAVVKGGRYDGLLGHFGKEAPAIGMVVVVNQLLNALERQKSRLCQPPLSQCKCQVSHLPVLPIVPVQGRHRCPHVSLHQLCAVFLLCFL